jgi:hypothetical protein
MLANSVDHCDQSVRKLLVQVRHLVSAEMYGFPGVLEVQL